MENGNFILKSVKVKKNLSPEVDLLEVKFDIGEPVFMFNSYADVERYIGEEVYCTFRPDIVDGQMETVVNQLSVLSKVTVVDRDVVGKLYAAGVPDIGSNIVFDDLNIGDFVKGAVVYCVNLEYSGSGKATWAELTVLDKKRRSAKLKVFDPERKSHDFVGCYVKGDLRYTKYGFNAQDIYVEDTVAISANPEIELAERFVLDTLKGDSEILDYLEKSQLLSRIKSYNNGLGYEVGFLLVKMAMELALAKEIGNLVPVADIPLLMRAVVFGKTYVLTDSKNNLNSKRLQGFIQSTTHKAGQDKRLRNILQDDPKEEVFERILYANILDMTEILLKGYKTFGLLLSSDKIWKS